MKAILLLEFRGGVFILCKYDFAELARQRPRTWRGQGITAYETQVAAGVHHDAHARRIEPRSMGVDRNRVRSDSRPVLQCQARSRMDGKRNSRVRWFAAFHCNFTAVGDEPNPDPNWRLLFADICDNWWWDSTIFTATIPANHIVQNKVEYYVRTGNNVFVHFDTEETVGRTLDERVSTRIYWEAGPPPSGGAGQGS